MAERLRSRLQWICEPLSKNQRTEVALMEMKEHEPRKMEAVMCRTSEATVHASAKGPLSRYNRGAGREVGPKGVLFLDQVGLSPKQALTQYRIVAARDRLLTGCAVAEAALATGYESFAQFIAIFRRLTGQLPSQVVHLGRKQ